MATYSNSPTQNFFSLDELQAFDRAQETSSTVLRVKNLLMRMMEMNLESGGPPCISVSSVSQLSRIFHCSPEDVLHALHEMEQQGFEYSVSGADAPVVLRDAFAHLPARNKSAKARPFTLKSFFSL